VPGKRAKTQRDVKLTDEILKTMISYHERLVQKGIPEFGISTYEQFKIVKVYF